MPRASYVIARLRIVGVDWGSWSKWAEWTVDILSGVGVLVRPIATRHLTNRTPLQLDGVDTLIGRTAKVTRDVDSSGGRIRMGADEWTARTQHSGETFAVGSTVRILQVDGATAVVGDALE